MRPPSRRADGGFTLLELMAVIVILGGMLLLVPTNLEGWGARSRLENAANTLVAVVGASRAQAILDGFPAQLEVGMWRDKEGDVRHGYRWVITNLPAQRSEERLGEDAEDPEAQEPREREWIETPWTELPRGVVFSGVSEKENDWRQLREDRPYVVTFGPDGSVEKAFGLRIRSDDLEVSEENRTFSILVNGLTAEAASYDGYAEVPPQREEHEFAK